MSRYIAIDGDVHMESLRNSFSKDRTSSLDPCQQSSISAPMRSISLKLRPCTLILIGVLTPVSSMSSRFSTRMVHEL